MRLSLAAPPAGLAAHLAEQAAAMRVAIETGDRRAYGRYDTAFHLGFFRDCGNRYLVQAYDRILGRVAALRTHLALGAPGEPARSFDDHEVIVDLVGRNRPDEIAAILHEHILRTKTNYMNAIAERAKEPGNVRTLRLRRQLALTRPDEPTRP
jgi:DNA-binding GntR family transcriptional regulator